MPIDGDEALASLVIEVAALADLATGGGRLDSKARARLVAKAGSSCQLARTEHHARLGTAAWAGIRSGNGSSTIARTSPPIGSKWVHSHPKLTATHHPDCNGHPKNVAAMPSPRKTASESYNLLKIRSIIAP